MESKKLKGKLSISRVTSNVENDYIEIQLEDENSRSRLIEIMVDFESFAKALTGLCYQPCSYQVVDIFDLLGKKHECKTVPIEYPELHNRDGLFKDLRELMVKPYEIDGWVADRHEGFNGHKLKGGKYNFIFRRYVDVSDDDNTSES